MNRNKKEIAIRNNSDQPIYLQVELWADLYYLEPGESLRIVAYSDEGDPVEFELEQLDKETMTQVLTIPNNREYFICEEGLEINHMEYGSNVEGWSGPLHPKSSLKGRIKHKLSK